MIPNRDLLNVPVTCLPFEEQIMLILRWAKNRDSKAVCLANVHMIMEAYKKPSFKKVLQQADLVTPDGKPLVWMLRQLGIYHQNQVAGMDVFLNLCNLTESAKIPVYFLGSTQDILDKMKRRLERAYPILQVAGMKSIPFVPTSEILKSHDTELIEEINQSGAGIVFVCLGCPKQEIWMSHYQGHIKGVMVGVGAVFSMYAGLTPRAPQLIHQAGFEWLFRLLQEPRRLWYRYGSTIPPFIYLALIQLLNFYKESFSQVESLLSQKIMLTDLRTLNFSPEKLGVILIRQNIITKEELNEALLQQTATKNQKIGEILVRNNQISLSQLKFYLKNQNIRLGQLLTESRNVKKSTLNILLNSQENTNKKLGEIMVEQKIISEYKLHEMLLEQYLRRKGWFLNENILIDHNFFMQEQQVVLEGLA